MQILHTAVLVSAVAYAAGQGNLHVFTDEEKAQALEYMNTVRAQWGACNLKWDDDLEAEAANSDTIKTCSTPSTLLPGEAMTPYLFDPQDVNVPGLTLLWTTNEDMYLEDPSKKERVRSFLQVIWKSSLRVGCSSCYHEIDSGHLYYLNCRFEEKGNVVGQFEANIGNKGDTCDLCESVSCISGSCFTSSCNELTGTCDYDFLADGTPCSDKAEGGGDYQGTCNRGYCEPNLCAGKTCPIKSQCHLAGVCDKSSGDCTYEFADSTVNCDDGNPFTVEDSCDGNGVCEGEDRCEGKVCSQGSQCTQASTCDKFTGDCVGDVLPDGTSCDDGLPATVDDQCQQGVCVGTDKCQGVECTYTSNLCEFDYGNCDPQTGKCVFQKVGDGSPCDDGNYETGNDKCVNGVCVGEDLCSEVAEACENNPKDRCHVARCNPNTGECVQSRKTLGDDGSPCLTCADKNCSSETPPGGCYLTSTCDPETARCLTHQAPDRTPCDDGNNITVDDVCTQGVCKGVDKCAGVTCDTRPCLAGTCNIQTGKCDYAPADEDEPCDENNPQTEAKCKAGVCTVMKQCSSGNCKPPTDCHTAKCENTECVIEFKTSGTPCDDGFPESSDDKCNNGVCEGDFCVNVMCEPPSDCYEMGQCDPRSGNCTAVLKKDGALCDDGNNMTGGDSCSSGLCIGRDLCDGVMCDLYAGNTCYDGVCNPQTGNCTYKAKEDGFPCDDNSNATVKDSCNSKMCVGVNLCDTLSCPPLQTCQNEGTCDRNTGKCEYTWKAVGDECNDGNNVTTRDACTADHKCIGENLCLTKVCGEATRCKVGTCNSATGQCEYTLVMDGTECGADGSKCFGGMCVNLCRNVSCLPASQCEEQGTCDPLTGECTPVFKANGTLCDDNNAKTGPDMCEGNGKCTGEDLCANVECKVIDNGCFSASVCDPSKAVEGLCSVLTDEAKRKECEATDGLCTRPIEKDGTSCDDGNASTFRDVCRSGQCVGSTCAIKIVEQFGACNLGVSAGGEGNGGFGFTPEGNLYVDNGCYGVFMIEQTGETVECGSANVFFSECPLNKRMTMSECLPDVICRGECMPLSQCHEAGICNNATGRCTNPRVPDGTFCDDGDNTTTRDVCEGGRCIGYPDHGCFRASVFHPSRECIHDDSACFWGSNVWSTMEECCRPGNAHKAGCAPAPANGTECWRAGKWWPNRECVKDDSACDWGMGTNVFPTKEECCEPGAAFDCGCNEAPKEKDCWAKVEGFPERKCQVVKAPSDQSCTDYGKTKGKVYFGSENECCSTFDGGKCCMACKSLDVVLVIDGSGSMSQRFTTHPMGFDALMDMLAVWVKDLPLTGEKAGIMNDHANGGVRVGMVQFSSVGSNIFGISKAIKTPSRFTSTTGGRLSGDKEQLLRDVEWHRANFIGKGTLIKKGLEMAAEMFEDNDTPRALIIISDGEIKDPRSLSQARRELDKKGVVVFGVVVRRYPFHTFADDKAERTLMPILSKPADDHFYNLEINDVPDKVLKGVCDPDGKWGSYLVPPTPPPSDPAVFTATRPLATGSANVYLPDKEVKPFDDLDCDKLHGEMQCNGKPACDALLDGATVSIESGLDPVHDSLTCTRCRELGMSVEYRQSTGVIILGTGTPKKKTLRQYTEALAGVTFLSTSPDCADRTFTYAYGSGLSSSTSDGHTYQYFSHRSIRWDEAATKCASKIELGRTGYLATLTSAEETELAMEKLGGQGWIGGSDAGVEGKWRWVTGPEGCPPNAKCDLELKSWTRTGESGASNKELGTYFFDQSTMSPVPGMYSNFDPLGPDTAEPNNYHKWCPGSCLKAGEDFAHMKWPSGLWNDFPIDERTIDGYICEWGGLESDKLCIKSENLVGWRTLSCGKNPAVKPAPTCAPKPDRPLSKGGCASGWVVAPTSTKTRNECANTCLKNGKLQRFCTPHAGTEQECICLPEQVVQCRCDNPLGEDEYCADMEPLGNGRHTCSLPVGPLEGSWMEARLSYTGVPPATNGDTDSEYQCHSLDRTAGSWTSVGEGQCRDEKERYFASYKTAADSEVGCKDLCQDREGCHAVHWRETAKECHLNAKAVGSCGPMQRRCSTPKKKPPTGSVCGCTSYLGGATLKDTRVCVHEVRGEKRCSLPDADGNCFNGRVCTRSPVGTITYKPGGTPDGTKRLIGRACGHGVHAIVVLHICPARVCTRTCNGNVCSLKCPQSEQALLKAGCLILSASFKAKTNARSAHILEDSPSEEPMVMAYDAPGLPDDDKEAVFAAVSEVTAKSSLPAEHIAALPRAQQSIVADFKSGGLADAGRDIPPAMRTVASADGDNNDGTKDQGEGDDDEGMSAWTVILIIIGVAGGTLCIGVLVKRKQRVKWGDVAVQSHGIDDSSAVMHKPQYSEMGHGETEMDASLGARHSNTTPVEAGLLL